MIQCIALSEIRVAKDFLQVKNIIIAFCSNFPSKFTFLSLRRPLRGNKLIYVFNLIVTP